MQPKNFSFGKTYSGLSIPAFDFGIHGQQVLILGGVHGDEHEGVAAAWGLWQEFCDNFPFKLQVTLVPSFNLDGVLKRQRVNGRGVDLNRNLPTKDWVGDIQEPRYYPGPAAGSESENAALIEYLDRRKPKFIISLHSWHPLLNINGNCRKEAEVIQQHTGYEIKEDIGYPTPGCLGTYCGLERDIPTITYEIQRGQATDAIVRTHVFAIREALKIVEGRG